MTANNEVNKYIKNFLNVYGIAPNEANYLKTDKVRIQSEFIIYDKIIDDSQFHDCLYVRSTITTQWL